MNWTFMKVCDYEGKGGVVDGLVGASQTAWKTLFRLLHQAQRISTGVANNDCVFSKTLNILQT